MGKSHQQSKKHHKEISKSRRINIRKIRKYYLIVCEGEKSEPLYFEGLAKKLPRGQVTLDIIPTGKCTTAVIDCALDRQKATSREYDQVWTVFDRDDFPADSFNEAIRRGTEKRINCAYSNESFELWYVLHFHYSDSALHRSRYIEILGRVLGVKYDKTDKEIYDKLQRCGDEAEAIKRAKSLFAKYDHRSPASENPSTTVYKLVEELNKYKQ